MIPGMICEGPLDAEIMIVGEAPGKDEELYRQPFIGQSGKELSSMLAEVGILRHSCFITNVTSQRPPGNDIKLWFHTATEAKALGLPPISDKYPNQVLRTGIEQLHSTIRAINPRLIIALGEVALWALTGKSGITKWRGSVLPCSAVDGVRSKVLPTFHPAAILRQWSWRWITVQDLRRAAREATFDGLQDPGWRFTLRPSFASAMGYLRDLRAHPRPFTEDIETRGGQISCVGIGTSTREAICIPFLDPERDSRSYWSFEEEYAIRTELRDLNTSKQSIITFQNGAYDLQYFAKEEGYKVNIRDDTMVMQHVAFAGLKKSLDFQASLYNEQYKYWKDDGKEWDPRIHLPEQHWAYNCEDCCRTFENREVLEDILRKTNLWSQYREQMDRIFPAAFRMMLRGTKINTEFRRAEDEKLEKRRNYISGWFEKALGHPLNPSSNPQMKNLFYGDFNIPVQVHKKTKRPSLDDDAMQRIYNQNPLLRPLLLKIAEWRSLGVFRSTFFGAPLSADERMRCTFNLALVETYRWSSSEDPFGTGTNLQNIPKDKPSKVTLRVLSEAEMPNIRKMFVPDEGKIILEGDLQRADAQVVAWEANDESLKQMFREGADIHTENAKAIFKVQTPTKTQRQACKQGVHLTNYGGKARTLAMALGSTVHEAEIFQRNWFGAHPGVKDWHDEVFSQLCSRRYVENKFGYRRFYFDRVDHSLLGQALAWIPQSTVALCINKALANINENLPEVELLLQVHDSLVMQFNIDWFADLIPRVHQNMLIEVPYDDPLVIPVTMAASEVSWGDADEKYPGLEELIHGPAKVKELA